MKRVMIDQGSWAKIMYPDLSKYDIPLVGFDGNVVVLEGQIKLLVGYGKFHSS